VKMAAMRGRDTKTRYQGVFARHQQACRKTATGDAKACHCTPSYFGVVWDRAAHKHRKTRRFARAGEARHARQELADALREGKLPASSVAGPRFDDSRDKYVEAARSGVALNKWGRRYRERAVEDLESALRHVPDRLARRRLGDVRRADVQKLVDDLSANGLSGSRIRSIVNAIRSLYRWAQDREMTSRDPAALVRLPAMDATPRDRVATTAEFARLLAALPLEDALPFALAGYVTARRQEIRVLDWTHIDLKLGALELAADEAGRKPGGSWRVVPLVKPALTLLKRAWIAQGRPRIGKVCPPRRATGSGMLALGGLQRRIHEEWEKSGHRPIGLHEARHTAATWLDHAGVSPKVASEIMGHKTPEYQPGAASITLRRYTHTLPGELERARDLLDHFLADREQQHAADQPG
jgi:integrase